MTKSKIGLRPCRNCGDLLVTGPRRSVCYDCRALRVELAKIRKVQKDFPEYPRPARQDTRARGAKKKCSKCRKTYLIDEFSKESRKRDGLHPNCKYCQRISSRNFRLKKEYGITLAEYEAMLTEQGGVCFICGKSESDWGSLAVDHCHKTGKIRKLLCFSCNTSIGKFNDDPALLRKAADYLEAHH